MARIADSKLAGAVSAAGGLGIIACGGAPLAWIEEQVRIAREIAGDAPLGANVMLMDPQAPQVAELLTSCASTWLPRARAALRISWQPGKRLA